MIHFAPFNITLVDPVLQNEPFASNAHRNVRPTVTSAACFAGVNRANFLALFLNEKHEKHAARESLAKIFSSLSMTVQYVILV